jgi:hypothetical protein
MDLIGLRQYLQRKAVSGILLSQLGHIIINSIPVKRRTVQKIII